MSKQLNRNLIKVLKRMLIRKADMKFQFADITIHEQFGIKRFAGYTEIQILPCQVRLQKIDAFLQFNEYKILKDAGKVSHDIAKKLAEKEYEKFRVIQDKTFESDFDKQVKSLKRKMKSDE